MNSNFTGGCSDAAVDRKLDRCKREVKKVDDKSNSLLLKNFLGFWEHQLPQEVMKVAKKVFHVMEPSSKYQNV